MTDEQIPAVPVHIESMAPGAMPAAAAAARTVLRLIPRTITLTAAYPTRLLLPLSASREYATVQALDTAGVVCDSQGQADQPANDDTTLAAPEGAVIPVGMPVPLLGHNELWITAPTLPARFSVVAAYCE